MKSIFDKFLVKSFIFVVPLYLLFQSCNHNITDDLLDDVDKNKEKKEQKDICLPIRIERTLE